MGILFIFIVVTLSLIATSQTMHKGLRFCEKFGYLFICFVTLGIAWCYKVLIKVAILEALKGDRENR